MTTWHPTGSDTIALVSDLAAMASSVDDEITEVTDVRQMQTFIWLNAADRTGQTGAQVGDMGFQVDTHVSYVYDGSDWFIPQPTYEGVDWTDRRYYVQQSPPAAPTEGSMWDSW